MTEPSPSEKQKSKAVGFFIAAGVALIVLALSWSIDASFVYIFLGVATFLAFLGFWNWPWQPRTTRYRQEYTQTSRPESRGENPDRNTRVDPTPASFAADTRKKARAIVTIVSVFIFVIFLFIVLGVVFQSGDDELVSDYYAAAEQFYGTNQYDSAYINYKRALRENPEHAEAMLGLGNTFLALENPDSAMVLYDQALAVNPDMDAARYNKGWVHYDQKRYADAERELVALVDKNPSYLEAMQMLGNVFYDQQRYDEALKWYERAYTNGFKGSWICHVMGFLYQNKGDNKRAIELYKESLTYDSTVLDVYQRLGQIVPGKEGEHYRQRGAGQQW